MTLGQTVRTAAAVGLLSLAVVALGHELFYLHWWRSPLGRMSVETTDLTAETLDRDLRSGLPAGSSRNAVETALRHRHIDYEFASAHEVDAFAHRLKGDTAETRSELWMRFQFDDRERLRSIDSRVTHTGR